MEPSVRTGVVQDREVSRGGALISRNDTLTPEATRRRAFGQILLLSAGFFVLVAISALSVILVTQSRRDNAWVVHTVEVENQMSTLLLEIRRAEGAARGYLLTSEPSFLDEYKVASAAVLPDLDKLENLTVDNPVQIENIKQLRPPVAARLDEFTRTIDFASHSDVAGGIAMLHRAEAEDSVRRIDDIAKAMRAEENRLFAERTKTADRTQQLASIDTVVASALVLALAAISIFLVRRSSRERD